MTSEGVALVCQIYPKNVKKQERVLELLQRGAREYYRKPEARCSTWTYFMPVPSKRNSDLVIGGLEIYDMKSALQAQVNDPVFFQAYHDTVKQEDLYSKDEELVAWYLTKGFIARDRHATPFGGCLISLSKFVAKDRQKVLQILEDFVPFVRDQEPGVLTYAVFTRPKAPNEILLFVRYKDSHSAQGHNKAPEHVDVVKRLVENIENDATDSTTVWQEIEDSFVSTQVGGPAPAISNKTIASKI